MNPINVVWENTVDGGWFLVRVTQPNRQVMFREGEGVTFDDRSTTGTLFVQVVGTGEVLLNEETAITAGAIFGPDAGDVAAWQVRAIEVIDGWFKRQGEPIPPD